MNDVTTSNLVPTNAVAEGVELVPPTIPESEVTPVDPVEESAAKFTLLLPYVRKFGATMSSKGLTRVLHAIAEFPLGATKPRLLDENERQLFHVMQELQGHKSHIISDIIQKQAELEKLKQNASQDVTETDKTDGGN